MSREKEMTQKRDELGRRASISLSLYLVQPLSTSFMHVSLYPILQAYNWPSPPPRTLNLSFKLTTGLYWQLIMVKYIEYYICNKYGGSIPMYIILNIFLVTYTLDVF